MVALRHTYHLHSHSEECLWNQQRRGLSLKRSNAVHMHSPLILWNRFHWHLFACIFMKIYLGWLYLCCMLFAPLPIVIIPDKMGWTLRCSHRAQWSLDPWIEPSSRLSVCGWAPRLTRRWNSASLEWKWGLCCCLSASDTGQDQGSGFLAWWPCWHLPWPLGRPPVGGGCPFCGGSLSSYPGGNSDGLGWTRPQRSV